jgi:GNAT superfamily N-acetyltransferase
MDVRIRPYEVTDFDAVTTLWFESWRSTDVVVSEGSGQDELRERFPKEITGGWSVHVALNGEEIVGFVALKGDKLEQLFVAPRRQGGGVGKQLLDFVKSQRPSGFYLTIHTLNRARWFYEREGLRPGKTASTGFGYSIQRYDWCP